MTQAELYYPPASHTHDPATSYEAEEAITESGQRDSDKRAVYQAVCDYPDSTGSELAAVLGWELYRVRRRLSDLHNADLIEQGISRTSAGRNRAESEWRAR